MARTDFYTLLGVGRNAGAAELKGAYRRLAVTWHPDRNPGSRLAEERFKAIAEAYAVLSNPDKRRQYDLLGPDKFHREFTQEDIFKGFDIGDLFKLFGADNVSDSLLKIFGDNLQKPEGPGGGQTRLGDFFGEFGRKPGDARDRRSPDIAVPLMITLREAAGGCLKEVAYNTPSGVVKLKVRVPPGAGAGQKITLPGQGPAKPGQEAGNVVVSLSLAPDPDFRPHGHDLHTTIALTAGELAAGARPVLRNLAGRPLRLSIPAGARPGARFKLAGQGLPKGPGVNGDLIVTVTLTDG